MKNNMILYLILLALIITNCKDNSVEPPPPSIKYDPLIPLNVGNYWLYRGYELNSDGTINFINEEKFGFIIHEPPSQLNNSTNPKLYQISHCEENLIPVDDTNYLLYGGSKLVYQNENGFNYAGIVRKDSLVITFDDLIFPYPAEKGKSVSGHVFYYSTLGNYSNVPDYIITDYTCISTDSLFTTPLGDFTCIVYKMAYVDFEPLFRDEIYYFIKPGLGIVGMVQMVYHYSSKEYTYIRKTLLTDYEIK